MSLRRAPGGRGRRVRGASLVEVVVSIVVSSILVTTMWNAWSLMTRHSADPLVARQMLIAAQSLLREIELQPLPGQAAAGTQLPGRTGFASIADYHGLRINPLQDTEGQAMAGLQGYGAEVSVTAQTLSGAAGYMVKVTVTGPDGHAATLGQWRAIR